MPIVYRLIAWTIVIILSLAACYYMYRSKMARTHLPAYDEQLALPEHVAIIMDGNRRWARERGQSAWQGHAAGVEPVKQIIQVCLEKGIPYLSLYVFSLENFSRPQTEIDYLFNILAEQIAQNELAQICEQGVKIQVVGDRSRFPEHLRETIERVELTTKDHTKLTVSFLFCYAGQQDIVNAARQLAHEVATGSLRPDAITTERFRATLWTGHLPPPDVIIRTGKAQRLSNFFTFDTSYCELIFMDCFWPDITADTFTEALNEFGRRTRTFGT